MIPALYKEDIMSCDIEGLGCFTGVFEEGLMDEDLEILPETISMAIFSENPPKIKMKKPVNNIFSQDEIQRRIYSCLQKTPLLEVNRSVTVGGTASWGGKEGVQYSGYAKGEVKDNKGNKAEVKVEQKSDGTGNLSVSATHEKSKPSNSKEKNDRK